MIKCGLIALAMVAVVNGAFFLCIDSLEWRVGEHNATSFDGPIMSKLKEYEPPEGLGWGLISGGIVLILWSSKKAASGPAKH